MTHQGNVTGSMSGGVAGDASGAAGGVHGDAIGDAADNAGSPGSVDGDARSSLGGAVGNVRGGVADKASDTGNVDGRPDALAGEHYRFFNHVACEYYPCHDMEPEKLNCLFCFCPLYCLGDTCGGAFRYIGDVKDCSACTLPHRIESYDYLMAQFARIGAVAPRTRAGEKDSEAPAGEKGSGSAGDPGERL